LNYAAIKCRLRGPVARQPSLPWQPVCAPLVGGGSHITPDCEVDRPTQYWVIAIFNWIRYVTLWPWTLTFWPWSHVAWCHLGVQSLYQVWTGYDLPVQS